MSGIRIWKFRRLTVSCYPRTIHEFLTKGLKKEHSRIRIVGGRRYGVCLVSCNTPPPPRSSSPICVPSLDTSAHLSRTPWEIGRQSISRVVISIPARHCSALSTRSLDRCPVDTGQRRPDQMARFGSGRWRGDGRVWVRVAHLTATRLRSPTMRVRCVSCPHALAGASRIRKTGGLPACAGGCTSGNKTSNGNGICDDISH
jgi:hypothetical protein